MYAEQSVTAVQFPMHRAAPGGVTRLLGPARMHEFQNCPGLPAVPSYWIFPYYHRRHYCHRRNHAC
jgi:hypothetical protein